MASNKKIPIGLQLYSIRKDCERDLPMVLREVKKMGYDGVEFAGYYNRTAKDLRKLLDDNGLKCCGTHTGLDTVRGDALKQTAEFNQVLGNKYLIVPWMGEDRMGSLAALKQTIAMCDDIARQAKALGARVGYHAHGGDFKKTPEGIIPWDYLFENTSADFVMQLDTGNAMDGGADPVAVLEKFPGRSATVHLKEHGGPKGAVIGEGVVDWKQVFRICEATGGTEWYIVEQESYVGTPLDSVRQCIQNLRRMGK